MANAMDHSRSRFLTAAAIHYAFLAPATSAHLMSQNLTEAAGGKSPVDETNMDGICKACGTVLIPGWTSRTTIARKERSMKNQKIRSKNRQQTKALQSHEKFIRVDCLKCYRFREEPLAPSRRKGSELLRVIKPQATASTAQKPLSPLIAPQQSSRPTATNAGSKQRAKARKHGGLQAMLEKSKASESSWPGYGLDLLDLMKQD